MRGFSAVLMAIGMTVTALPVRYEYGSHPPPILQPFEARAATKPTTSEGDNSISPNVKVYGAVVGAESCSYDPVRKVIVAVNRGVGQDGTPGSAFISLINHDGSVQATRWILPDPGKPIMNQPLGSDIHAGKLYVADSKDGPTKTAPRLSVIREFDMNSHKQLAEIVVPESTWFNDIAVADDGIIYASQTGELDGHPPMRIYRITPEGTSSVLVEGAPLSRPNGIAMDGDGNIVVVNVGNTTILTFSPKGRLLKTEHAVQAGSDGLVILRDGTKYVSSVLVGGVSRIRPGRSPELIATGIRGAASMCFDVNANQLVIPMVSDNALAFIKLY